jgi:hypothetical protein
MSDDIRSRWDRDEPLDGPPEFMWLVPANLGGDAPDWDTTLGSSRPEGFNLETKYVRAEVTDANEPGSEYERGYAAGLEAAARECDIRLAGLIPPPAHTIAPQHCKSRGEEARLLAAIIRALKLGREPA